MRKLAIPTLAAGLAFALPAVSETQWYAGGSIGKSAADLDEPTQADLQDLTDLLVTIAPGASIIALDVESDESDLGWKVFGGIQINRHFAAELFYADTGDFSQTASADLDILSLGQTGIRAEAEFSGDAIGVEAKAGYPLTEQFRIFAKAGVARWSVDLDTVATVTGGDAIDSALDGDSDDGTGLVYGLGASLQLTDTLRARVEWERLAVEPFDDDVDVDLVTGGIEILF